MPNQRPAAARFSLFAAQLFIADGGASCVQTFLKAGLIPDDAGSDFVRKLAAGHEVT